MDKVLIDIEVVKGIIKAYNRSKNQTRIFGIILGTKKDNLYHISDVIYGFIFEEGENKETHKKTYVRLNEDNLNSILNSYTHKFKLFPQQKVNEKILKEKDISFLSCDNLMILGGFATDKELFNDLHNLYFTIEQQINNTNFKVLNSLILLVDPNHKNDKKLEYGIKTYIWEMKTIKINKEFNLLLTFKQIENEVIQNLNSVHLINSIFSDKTNPEIKLYNTELDKNEKKLTTDILYPTSSEDKSKEDINSKDYEKNNLSYIKNKVKQSLEYLNIFEKYLEEKINKKDGDSDSEILDQISIILSKLEPIIENEEINKILENEIHKNDNINSLTQLLEVQLNLSEKIQHLIN